MANITGLQTIDLRSILEVDSDPSAGGGTAALISSLALRSDVGQLWLKTGTGNTAWNQVAFDAASFTTGSVIFAGASGALAQDNSNFFFDDTNFRLGIGTATPSQSIDTTGSIRTRALGAGVVHSDATGLLTSSAVVLTSDVSGILPVANGGTNSSTTLNNSRIMVSAGGSIVEAAALTNGQLLIGSTGAAPVAATLTAGTGVSITNGAGTITINATGSGGTVTSVALTAPSFLTVSGSPITSSGTLALTLATQTANTIFAGPTTGAAAAPTFRAQVLADLPQLTNGQLYVGSTAASVVAATLTGTANQVVVTNAAGTITLSTPQSIAATSSVTFANVTDSALTANGALYAGTAGLLTSTAAMTNGQLLIGSTGSTPVLGTLTGTANEIVVTNAAGSITLSTPQAIAAGSSPTFAGLTISTFTLGSVIFAGASGALAQNNANFFWDNTNSRLGLGGTTTPVTTLDVVGKTTQRGSINYIDAAATNTSYLTAQAQVSTTTATATTLATVATTTNTTMMLQVKILGIRTGGTAGTAGDSATYIRTARIKNIAGTVTIATLQTDFTSEDQFTWNGTIVVSGTNALVQVTGATNNNVDWGVTYLVQTIV